MQTQAINVPADKAKQLEALAKLSVESLNILAAKANEPEAKRLAIEKKLKTFQYMI